MAVEIRLRAPRGALSCMDDGYDWGVRSRGVSAGGEAVAVRVGVCVDDVGFRANTSIPASEARMAMFPAGKRRRLCRE